MEQFLHQLCQELMVEISPKVDENEFDLSKFLRHVLFKTDFFCRSVMENLWKTQLRTRMAKLEALSASASFELQTQILQNCLFTLDYSILQMLAEKKRKGENLEGERTNDNDAGQIFDEL